MNRTRPGLSSTTFCCLALASFVAFAQQPAAPPPPTPERPGSPEPQQNEPPPARPNVRPAPAAPPPGAAGTPRGPAAQAPPPPAGGARRPANQPEPQGGQTISPGANAGQGQTVSQRRATCEQIRRRAKFNIYFDKVEIEKLVQTVSDATCKTFILPENVRGRISIVGPENGKVEVTADEFYRAFLAALDANGLAVYTQGDFSKIVDKRNAKQTPIPTIAPDSGYTTAEQMVTKIFKVRFVEVEPLRAVLQQLVSQNGDTIPFPPDTLIINDLGSNMHRLERIIRQLDSRSSSEDMRIIQVRFASAQEIADKIQKLFPPQQTGPGGRRQRGGMTGVPPPPAPPGVPSAAAPVPGGEPQGAMFGAEDSGGVATVSQIIPDERTNKLIVIASPAGFQRVEELVRMLDVPIPGEGRINVYYLENADAEELASTLQSLAQGSAARPRQAGGAPGAPTLPGGAPRPPGQAAELFSGEVKISADKATNSLVIIASVADYRNLVKVIEKLDMPRRQVFIEAVIMEVNVKRDGKFGARLHGGLTLPTSQGNLPVLFGSKFGDQERLPPSFSIVNLASFGGFLAGLQGPVIPGIRETLGIDIPAFGIVLHALQESSDANVLSTPHILTSDNEEAEITVGQNVPFQAGASPNALAGLGTLTSTATTPAGGINAAQLSSLFGGFVTPINRQNVELKLTVKPQINDSDFIRLVITEQTEEIASTHPVLGPTTSKRSAKTTVVARDQETIVLGGIMQDRTIEGVSKIPILGDLPILGHLFREETREKMKLNLLLFLTPYIIKDPSDFRRIFERKMKERQQFVEAFYGQVPGYEVTIDFDRKRGPLAEIGAVLRREQQKLENGGTGSPGEKLIVPGGTPPPPPPEGERTDAEVSEPPSGSEVPEDTGSPETRPADERVRVVPSEGDEQHQ